MTDKTIKKIVEAAKRGLLDTDSGIEDFAKANRLRFDSILECLANNTTEFKPCWGCKHIENRYYNGFHSPCTYCSRRIQIKDNFEQSPTRYRMKQ